jgi:hypothetical protein
MAVQRETIIERPVEKEIIVDRPVERETIVESDGGSGAALLGGILIAIVLAVLFFWMFSGGFIRGDAPVSIEPPAASTSTN